MNTLDKLITLFAKLPGLGKKSASRIVYHILEGGPTYALAIAEELASLHQKIKRCPICGGFTETVPCSLCADTSRERTLLCVVERPQDLRVIDESGEFKGRFQVLGGLIAPLEGVGPGDLAIDKLVYRVRNEGVREVILALNPTIEGDTTALYIQRALEATGVAITRLASGLPVGGDLEYTDKLTLARSLRSRVPLEER
jgi:recombination protein RecR